MISSSYIEGKRSALRGDSLATMASLMKPLMDVDACDFRKGVYVALKNKEDHPEWSDEFILSNPKL